jgi:hypothetical protein
MVLRRLPLIDKRQSALSARARHVKAMAGISPRFAAIFGNG